MTYIISHDFGQSTSYYVRVVDEATFDEVYNPEFATQFKTKKKAQEWIDIYSSIKEYSNVVDFDKSVQ